LQEKITVDAVLREIRAKGVKVVLEGHWVEFATDLTDLADLNPFNPLNPWLTQRNYCGK
jgi:hypothetical protein